MARSRLPLALLGLLASSVACGAGGGNAGTQGLAGAGTGRSGPSGATGAGGSTSTGPTSSGASSSASTGSGGSAGGSACQGGLSAGFDATPTPFSLPAPRCQTKFDSLASGNAALSFALLRLGGTAATSLVVFNDTCTPAVGTQRWDVYAGGATGFAASPTPYALPAPRCQTSFNAGGQAGGSLDYALLDLTGDGLPDLVVFNDGCDATVGATHWDVYAGGATGFAASPTPYALPAARCQTKFNAAAGAQSLGYALLDTRGGGRPDLVVTRDACDATVGATHWDVYAGGATGFAPGPSPFAVPPARCQTSFDALGAQVGIAYSLLNLTGSKLPQLVVTSDTCDATVGSTHWDVYGSTAAGFSASPTPYAVPAPRCQTHFDAVAGGTGVSYGLDDVSCSPGTDLVVTSDTCDATVGKARWDVYPGGATGFAAGPSSLTLPPPRCQTDFDSTGGTGPGGLGYNLFALVPGKPQLVVYVDPCDATVGASHWDLYTLP